MPADSELSEIFDAHVAAEFLARDVDATMATMTATPYVNHVPVQTGGYGSEDVRSFYARYFVGRWPADTAMTPVSRTVGESRVVDEFVLNFTHDVEMPAILPGVAPTGRHVQIPFVVIMGFDGDKIAYEHIYWDQGSMLAQIGLIDADVLPVSGADQAAHLLNPSLPANRLIERAGS
jgi:carboxymethylenebutenolidase